MAQTYYTLDEAADKLGISVSEFKKRLRTEWTYIRPLQDGSTQRFKAKDVEELSRQIGFGSEEELQLVDPSSDEVSVPPQLQIAEEEAPKSTKSPSSKKTPPSVKQAAEEDAVLPLAQDNLNLGEHDVFLLADESTSKKSSKKVRPEPVKKTDSDVRLGQSGKVKRTTVEEPSDEIELDILPKAGSSSRLSGVGKISSPSSSRLSSLSSGKLSPPKSGKSPPASTSSSSEFELSLDADSSDEFELSLANDSDEISLGDLPAPSSSDSKAGMASGINISKPKDAGLSLERGAGPSSKKVPAVKLEPPSQSGKSSKKLPQVKPGVDDSDEIDFELSLDQPGASSKKIASSKKLEKEDSSEFDLTLDEDSDAGINLDESTGSMQAPAVEEEKKNDIFETDFEIPALDDDSASEAVAIDEADTDLESSDFDLAIDESGEISAEEDSGSQVVVLDDEIEEEAPAKSKKSAKRQNAVDLDEDSDVVISDDAVSFDEMDLDEGESASKALKGLRKEDLDEDEDEERVVTAGTAPWGVLPALVMLPTVFIVFVAGLMAYEMMHSMWGYHQPNKPSSLVIDGVAELFDMKPKDDTTTK